MDFVYYNIQQIENMDIRNIQLVFDNEAKIKYGYVPTPFNIINKMVDNLPQELFRNKDLKWLDPGCGNGYISIKIYMRLLYGLCAQFESIDLCRQHILHNMLYMIDINNNFIDNSRKLFPNANIIHGDFLNYNTNMLFDVIVCNPPYVCEGIKKVPTNNDSKKTSDGITIWPSFIEKCVELLKPSGYLSTIIPSIWMKPDNKMYSYFEKYKIKSLCCYSNSETKKIFMGHAQTPTCSFVLIKENSDNNLQIYDTSLHEYVFFEKINKGSIPVFGVSIINRLVPFLKKYGSLYDCIVKTNMPSKKVAFYDQHDEVYKYKNIITCKLNENKVPYLVFNYSNKPLSYSGVKKLVLAHKMYGYPYYDESGVYGISNRDNYLILNKTDVEFKKLKDFLNSKLVRVLYESTRYRMKYLEKYAFDFIVDICNIEDFPEDINDENILNYFGFLEREKNVIMEF